MMSNRNKIENIEELIKDSIDGELVEQKLTSLLPPGENYSSALYKVDFKVKKDGKVEDYHAVAKCVLSDPVTRELANTQVVFKLEIAWYTTVIPTFKQFQKDQGVEETMDFFQHIYGARINLDPGSDKVDENAVILSKNLKFSGYKNVDRKIGFDLLTTHTILTKLATFHAVPLAISHHNPELFNKNVRPYLQCWISDNDLETQLIKAIFVVYEHIQECQSLMDRIRKTLDCSNIYQQRTTREPWATATHMDFWSNNIMVTDGPNPKVIILDLQCPGFTSLTADVALFLLTSVEHDVISNKFDDLLKFYHKEFIKNLVELKVPTEQFSFESFLTEFDTEVKISELAHALSHITIIYSDSPAVHENMMNIVDDKTFVNDKQIEKFKWITSEAQNRNWI